MDRRLLLFASRSHPILAQAVADSLGQDLGEIEIKDFANGEIYVRYRESLRGADVFLIGSPYIDVNNHLMEMLIMIDAARLASARSIVAVVPHYPYARQDKKSSGREPITAKLIATLLESAGATRVVSTDLHTGQIQGFFSTPLDHMTALPLLAAAARERGLLQGDVVIVSPDAGRVRLARRWADRVGANLALLTKERPAHNVAAITHVIGDVKGKTAILVDDMIDTGGTICAGAKALSDAGARTVHVAATHGVLSGEARERIENSPISTCLLTDTVPIYPEGKIDVVSVAPLLAKAISHIFEGESVSALFDGTNAF